MRGTIVINAEAGRTLCHQRDALMAIDALDCAGGFLAGDTVYVVVRGNDGGQGVIATGIARCDASMLLQTKGRLIDVRTETIENDDACVVIHANDLRLLWPSSE